METFEQKVNELFADSKKGKFVISYDRNSITPHIKMVFEVESKDLGERRMQRERIFDAAKSVKTLYPHQRNDDVSVDNGISYVAVKMRYPAPTIGDIISTSLRKYRFLR